MKTLITTVMLTVIATAGFAEESIETANRVISKGTFVTTVGEEGFFIMAYKGKAYTCNAFLGFNEIHCYVNKPDE